MFRFITTLCLVLMLVAMVTACSSGGGSIIPDGPDGFSASSQLPVYLNPSTEGVKSGTGALGVYQIIIDNSSLNYDVVPLRYSSFVPREFETDLTLALTTSFCQDCFKVTGVTLNANENILLEVGVKHPFPQVTTLPAPRPQRPDLHVFDVQGIVVVEGTTGFPRSGITLNPDFVVNPEGFTSVFDAAIDSLGGFFTTAANAHPFKILSMGNYVNPSDDIGNYDPSSLNGYPNPSGIMNPTGFNVMKGGCDYFSTTYELKSEGTSTSFLFAVTCSFGEAAKGRGSDLQKRDSPVYLLPAFSKPEAWKVAVDVENNGLADNDNTSTADIVIRVADWQEAYGATPANPAFDPSIDIAVPRNTLIHASGIHNVVVDIPSFNFIGDYALTQGMGNIKGVLLGTGILMIISELPRYDIFGLGRIPPEARYLVYGIIIVFLMRFRPQGLIPMKPAKVDVTEDEMKRVRETSSPLFRLETASAGGAPEPAESLPTGPEGDPS